MVLLDNLRTYWVLLKCQRGSLGRRMLRRELWHLGDDLWVTYIVIAWGFVLLSMR